MEAMARWFTRLSERWLPDPYIFAVGLTAVTWLLGIALTENGPWDMILHWQKGFWELLAFAMQMALIVVTGFAFATAPPVARVLSRVAGAPRTAVGAAALVAFVSSVAGLISWGLNVVLGALFAKEVAVSARQRGLKVHYPLLGAAAYMGMMVWHAGLSGSAPLLVATKGHFLEKEIGIIPVSVTLGNTMNLVVIAGSLVLPALLIAMVHPKRQEELQEIDAGIAEEHASRQPEPADLSTPAARVENSRLVGVGLGVIGMIYVVYHFATKGFDLNLNILNTAFLFLGLALHGTPARYVSAIAEGTKGVSGIILQFPFYAGIMGMMKYGGLVKVIAGWFVALSTPVTYPLMTYLSAAVVNLFVPSGGGQWAVQGPVAIEAAKQLGVPIHKAIMAMAYGDQLTDMLQPFWAIALLGITGLKARQIIGYTLAVMIPFGIFLALATFLPA